MVTSEVVLVEMRMQSESLNYQPIWDSKQEVWNCIDARSHCYSDYIARSPLAYPLAVGESQSKGGLS